MPNFARYIRVQGVLWAAALLALEPAPAHAGTLSQNRATPDETLLNRPVAPHGSARDPGTVRVTPVTHLATHPARIPLTGTFEPATGVTHATSGHHYTVGLCSQRHLTGRVTVQADALAFRGMTCRFARPLRAGQTGGRFDTRCEGGGSARTERFDLRIDGYYLRLSRNGSTPRYYLACLPERAPLRLIPEPSGDAALPPRPSRAGNAGKSGETDVLQTATGPFILPKILRGV